MPVTRGPARIQITDPRGATVYEGEGEIVQHDLGLALVQYRRMNNGDIVTRQVQLSQLMQGVPFRVSPSVQARMVDPSDWIAEGVRSMWTEPPELVWNISFGTGAEGFAEHLAGQLLSQPVESAEERRRLGEMRAQAYRTMDPDCISEALEAGAIDQAEADRLRVMHLAWGSTVPAARFDFAEVDLDANEELIRSTWSKFPHDPHNYDHPNTDEMRWSPPPEGEEVPSCPA